MNFSPTGIPKALLREKERQERTAFLTTLAAEMRKKGASEKSMRKVLEGLDEFFKLTSQPNTPHHPDLTPAINVQASGTFLSEVQTQAVQWLWERRIPLGKITILDGDPGVGKSLIATHIAACVSTGRPMPDGTPGKQGGVVLIAPEDGAEDTLKPRLEAAGGNPSHVLLLNTVEGWDEKKVQIGERPFSLSHDLEILEEDIKRVQALLVIFDPLMAVLGHNVDSSRDQDVREVFTPLAQIAERTGCAMLIIRHLNKGSADNPLYRGAGSIGIIAAARMGLIVAPHPDDEQQRILATTKNNLSKLASNLTYQIVENAHGVPYIQWLGENHHPVKALLSSANLSYERQSILQALKESATPLSPREVAERTGQHYDNVRKMLPRLLHASEIASPARGQYTTLDHPSRKISEKSAVPTMTNVPTTTNVPNVPISCR